MALNAGSKILEVESQVPDLNDVRVNGIPVWPYLRKVWHSQWVADDQGLPVRGKWGAVKQLKSALYGISSFLKPARVICFTDATLRKPLNGKYVDKNFQGIVEHFGEDNVLLVERLSHGAVSHKKHAQCQTKRLCSYSILLAFAAVLPKVKVDVEGEEVLQEAAKKYNVTVDHQYIFKNFYRQYRAVKWFLKWKKPHTVFVNCYYGKSAVIRAAKELGIPVVETQHGLIREQDSSYFAAVKLDSSLIPDRVLTFGTQELEILSKTGAIVSPEQCIPIGSYMMDAILSNKTQHDVLETFVTNFKRTIAVSGQEGEFEPQAVAWVNALAKANPDLGIIYVPRMVTLEKGFYNFEPNVLVCKTVSVYDVIRRCDIHATVYSTCALEAGSLGKPTILMNCNGLADYYLRELMPPEVVLGIANTPEELAEHCAKELKSEDEYRALNATLFVPDQKQALRKAFNQ